MNYFQMKHLKHFFMFGISMHSIPNITITITICSVIVRWLTKIKFVEKYIPRMNAGLEKATPVAMPVQPRTRAGLTGPASSSCRPTSLYKFVSHTLGLTHKLVTLPPIRGGGGGLECTRRAWSMTRVGFGTSYGRLDKV